MVIERIFFELGLIWAEIVRWAVTKDPIVILGLGILIFLILYLVLAIIMGLKGGLEQKG